jgi:hypothetical protein
MPDEEVLEQLDSNIATAAPISGRTVFRFIVSLLGLGYGFWSNRGVYKVPTIRWPQKNATSKYFSILREIN